MIYSCGDQDEPNLNTWRSINIFVKYFTLQIGRSDTCVTVTMHRIGLVAGLQPVPVRVYDYYEPSK